MKTINKGISTRKRFLNPWRFGTAFNASHSSLSGAAWILGACLSLFASQVSADIYKSVDKEGRVTFSNIPSKGAIKLDIFPYNSPPSASSRPRSATATPSPAGFPKVDTTTQKKRDDVRKKILEEELATESTHLKTARNELTVGEAVRLGEERHNYQKYLDRVQKLKETVSVHERNVAALMKELEGIR